MSEHPTPEHILQVGLGFWASKTLLSAVEMEVFTELAQPSRGPRDPARAARPAPALGARLLRRARRARLPGAPGRRLLATPPPPTSSSTSASPPTSAASSRWPTTASTASGAASPRACAPGGRRTRPRPAASPFFEALYADPARLREFLGAMTGHQPRGEPRDRRAVPVGATTRPSSTSAPPRATWRCRSPWPIRTSPASGFDLPEVGPIFEEYVGAQRARRAPRASRPAASSPTPCPQADVITMGHILHDWDLDQKRMLIAQGLRRPARGRRADRLRGDHRRRPLARTPSAC